MNAEKIAKLQAKRDQLNKLAEQLKRDLYKEIGEFTGDIETSKGIVRIQTVTKKTIGYAQICKDYLKKKLEKILPAYTKESEYKKVQFVK